MTRRSARGGAAAMAAPGITALAERLLALSPGRRLSVLRTLSPIERRGLMVHWQFWAHGGQREPAGDWRVWLIRAGRGFGKTRAGAEWVSRVARCHPEGRIALVGATTGDVRQVMIEGPSGLLAVARPGERPVWRPARGELRFVSGAVAQVFTAMAPEKLRGPEHHVAWCDELAKWRHGDAVWDNLMLGMRLGERPRVLVTTTPRPVPLVRRVRALPGLVETTGRSVENPHLPESFVAAMIEQYGGTSLGRQELDGELVEDVEGALWSRAMIEACRVAAAPELVRIVVGVDPAVSGTGDACGIVVAGLDAAGVGHVLEDASVVAMPEGWAGRVAATVERHAADRVVAEANQGGQMVRTVLEVAAPELPLTLVHASRGKSARAEPVATLYARGRMRHVGRFPQLEDELCGMLAGGGYAGPGRSPDRADALVWAVTELMLGKRGRAAIRAL